MREVIIFPYINITKIVKMDDFEIHPFNKYKLKKELGKDEIKFLRQYTNSFRESIFYKSKIPKKAKGIGILKYKGRILRTIEDYSEIGDKVKILFLLLKLHISIDFFNQWMSAIDIKSFEYYGFNLGNNNTSKYGNGGDCNSLYSTIPENIKGLDNITFYPLAYSINNIPVEFNIVSNSDKILGIHPDIIDMSYLYHNIIKDTEYNKKFINIASIHYGLETQKDLFFYLAIIPSILEVILYPIPFNKKKKEAIDYGNRLDEILINDNDFIETVIYTKISTGEDIKENIGLIARTFVYIYDIRNDLLHEGEKAISKLHLYHKGYKIYIYDIFQLIFKFSILNDFVDKGIISNDFIKLTIEGSIFTTGTIQIKAENNIKLFMDEKLNLLLEKAKSDKELKQGLYLED